MIKLVDKINKHKEENIELYKEALKYFEKNIDEDTLGVFVIHLTKNGLEHQSSISTNVQIPYIIGCLEYLKQTILLTDLTHVSSDDHCA